MAQVSTYLNFPRTTEAAFNFYRSVFKSEFSTPIGRFKDIPAQPGQPPLSETDKRARCLAYPGRTSIFRYSAPSPFSSRFSHGRVHSQ